jgi:hypothetical protein
VILQISAAQVAGMAGARNPKDCSPLPTGVMQGDRPRCSRRSPGPHGQGALRSQVPGPRRTGAGRGQAAGVEELLGSKGWRLGATTFAEGLTAP